jgi:hypothetical protein
MGRNVKHKKINRKQLFKTIVSLKCNSNRDFFCIRSFFYHLMLILKEHVILGRQTNKRAQNVLDALALTV